MGIAVILEDNALRQEAMRQVLRDSHSECEPLFFDNAPGILRWLEAHLAEARLICLDHDLGPNRDIDGVVFDPGTGRDVVSFLVQRPPTCPVVVHTSNPEAAPAMVWELESAGWRVWRVIPFGDLAWVELSWAERIGDALRATAG